MRYKGTRILRYVGSRQEPEIDLWGPDSTKWTLTPGGISMPNVQGIIDVGQGIIGFDKSSAPDSATAISANTLDTLMRARMMAAMQFSAPLPLIFRRWMDLSVDRPSEPFEVNMVEPLVGWRKWQIHGEHKILRSQFAHRSRTIARWHPDKPMVAVCRHEEVPHPRCACGIYATTDRNELKTYNGIAGEVFGWGRYVRGTEGWRSEFAYPKSFHLEPEQVTPPTMDVLRKYHVPIYVAQPTQIYSPEEDGYGNWTAEENRDSRADQEPDAAED